ncbi:uncharacterized protein LY79DRAFT_127105 [Colletotrichum navitas]|uniref:Uncharacterized protein n=1 Tax=Colletotrichum navitas TaxID=681940 RepID=A0AAD8Q2R8_9PEZI|nr:uncharacterized protein LY79DRAFT_127105 [Colletotrichum navitas]KAK1594826.1 hypothetical protein LY79DRAFT_127105 [Colletotrichum navitas]
MWAYAAIGLLIRERTRDEHDQHHDMHRSRYQLPIPCNLACTSIFLANLFLVIFPCLMLVILSRIPCLLCHRLLVADTVPQGTRLADLEVNGDSGNNNAKEHALLEEGPALTGTDLQRGVLVGVACRPFAIAEFACRARGRSHQQTTYDSFCSFWCKVIKRQRLYGTWMCRVW